MATLGIFTVKRFWRRGAEHWTNGGFGEYLNAVVPYFERTVVAGHVTDAPPPAGSYRVDRPEVEFVSLSWPRHELDVLLSLPAMLRGARRLMPRLDVVHARMPDYTGVVGAYAARLHGVPCFHQVVADWKVEARGTPLLKKGGLGALLKAHLHLYDHLERRVSRGALVFAQGTSPYEKHRAHADCELVFSSAHHDADLREPRPRLLAPPYRVLGVGRLTGVKNHSLLLRAIARLRAGGADWRLTLVGDGPHRARLEREAAELGIGEAVEFAGLVAHGEALWRHYDRSDLFVLASRSEGTPKALLEAMARGVPVIATAVGGIPAMVEDGRSGLLFPDDDLDALVARMRAAAAGPGAARERAARALEFAREHTVERETDAMMRRVFARWPHLRRAAAAEPA
jgi:glycosyltransferase involved in cell wall biosynthesis